MINYVRQLQKISIDKLVVPKQNVRTQSIDKGLDELKANIRSVGLIEPISVYKELDQYVVLAGQRRLNAYYKLNDDHPNQGFDEIECLVTDSPKDDDMKRAISLGENITHLPMSSTDLQSAVTELYNKCDGNYTIIEQKFGLTRYIIDKYVGLSRLPEKIKQSIQSGGIHTKQRTAENIALKAVEALHWTPDGNVSEDKVLELANVLGSSDNIELKNDIVVETKKNPEGYINENVERAKNKTHDVLMLRLDSEQNEKLTRYSKNRGDVSKEDTAVNIIAEKLDSDTD